MHTRSSPSRIQVDKQTHLLAGQGTASPDDPLSIRLGLFPHLQQLHCLDEGLECGHSAPCL